MIIAVTYDNGNVFQHFGKTEAFKLFEVEDGKILSSQVISSNGAGHGALAGVLSDHKVNLLICGGLGNGALNALNAQGIEVCSGASGDVDKAVADYIHGDLVSQGSTCDHHDHECGEDHECGGHCDPQLTMEGKNAGKKVRVHYRGTLNDGTQFDSSYDRNEPLEFVCATGMMIKGFDAAVVNMEVGEKVNVHLMPEEAYGPADPKKIISIPFAQLPGSEKLEIGQPVMLQDMYGQAFRVTVKDKSEDTITFDMNHEMAGKELNFEIELLEVL